MLDLALSSSSGPTQSLETINLRQRLQGRPLFAESVWVDQPIKDRGPGHYYTRWLPSGEQSVHLRQSLRVDIEAAEDGGVNACAPAMELYGWGVSSEAALRDLSSTILLLWNDYRATAPHQLDAAAQALLARLRLFLQG